MGAIDEEKKKIRSEILKKRNSISPPDLLKNSEIICNYIMAGSKFIRATDVLLYSNYGSEVITAKLCDKALKDGKNVYYPKVEGEYISFYKVSSPSELNSGFMGILEPYGFDGKFNKSRDAIIIVPGSAFGRDGYRIGYGKGYYDKFLCRNLDIYKIGVCFDLQLLDRVPKDEHDIQLDEIITEKCILTRSGKGEARWV